MEDVFAFLGVTEIQKAENGEDEMKWKTVQDIIKIEDDDRKYGVDKIILHPMLGTSAVRLTILSAH